MQSVPPNLPVGWRFQPSSEELLDHYLKKKRLGQPIYGSDIQDIQICDLDPEELLDENYRDKERYLFCRRLFHLKTGGTQKKRKRKGKAGYWKRTGEIQSITLEDSGEVIGTKTIFVYQNPEPTEYVKHEFEYTAELDSPIQDDYDFVLCKLMISKKKKTIKKAKAKKEPVSKKKENVEVDYEKTNPNKKARKGLSYCDTASVSIAENRNQGKIMANSTFREGEPRNHRTSDIEYQNPSTRRAYSTCVEGEPSYHNTSDFEYQHPSDRKAYSACKEGEPSNHNSCDFENQNPSDRKAFLACGDGQAINHMTSDSEDQRPVPMTTSSICRKGDSSHQGASDLNNQTPKEINDSDVLRYNLGETNGLVAAELDNQNPNEMTYMSSYEVSDPGCPSSSWVGNQNPCEMTIVSIHKRGETSSLTYLDIEDDRNQNEVISYSHNGKGKLYLDNWDFENQNPNEKTDISPSVEGYEKIDMSYPEHCWSGSLASGVQETENQEVESHYKKTDFPNLDDVGVATFPEIDSQILDELTTLDELLDTLCSEATQPIDTNESLN